MADYSIDTVGTCLRSEIPRGPVTRSRGTWVRSVSPQAVVIYRIARTDWQPYRPT